MSIKDNKELKKRILYKLLIPLLHYMFIAFLATMSVYFAIELSIIKMDYLTGGFQYVTHSDYILAEYSLTIGFLSLLLFNAFNILYKIIKSYIKREVLNIK